MYDGIRQINLEELKQHVEYCAGVAVLITDYCPKGVIFLVRKEHLGKTFGIGFGKDIVIGSPEDFGYDFLTEQENEPSFRVV